MNQKEAFFDINHVMQDSDKEDGFIVVKHQVQMECG